MPEANRQMKNIDRLRDRILACWVGKSVGGTLGMPYEGCRELLDLSYYDPVPQEMLPNDDLDLQVVWAYIIDQLEEPEVDRHVLAEAWREHVGFAQMPDEYGVAKRNLALGLTPPQSGSYDNWFQSGMGAAIRSELWACLAAGDPELAAQYAYEDACVDHAGEGIYAEQFLAALQSAAFVEQDPQKLLDMAMEQIPGHSRLRRALWNTRSWWRDIGDWKVVREKILEKHEHENFTDVVMNLSFIVLGWLASDGDFSRGICTAVNCGMDTDCTGATLGSLMGILDPDGIDEKWLAPIGNDLILSPGIEGVEYPPTLDGFTDLVLKLREQLAYRPVTAKSVEQPLDHLGIRVERAFTDDLKFPLPARASELLENSEEIVLAGTFAEIPYEDFQGRYMLLRYRFTLDTARDVKILFNTPEDVRVWIDGEEAFGRECGRMCPAFHRAPVNQNTQRKWQAGEHEVTAVIHRPLKPRTVRWIIGCGDAKNNEWIVGSFNRCGVEETPNSE